MIDSATIPKAESASPTTTSSVLPFSRALNSKSTSGRNRTSITFSNYAFHLDGKLRNKDLDKISFIFAVDTNAGINKSGNFNILNVLISPRVLGAIGGGAAALILFVVMSILVYKRRKAQRIKKEVIPFSDTPYSDVENGKRIKRIQSKISFLILNI